MFQTTRRRLAIWYTTVTAVLLLLFASGFYLYVRETLIERIDDTLNHVVEVVGRSLVIEPVNPHSEGGVLRVNVEASFRDSAATGEDDHIDLEWFSPTGALLWSTLSEPLNVPLNLNSQGETVHMVRGDSGNLGAIVQQPESEEHRDVRTASPNLLTTNNQKLTTAPPVSPDSLILRQVTERIEVGRQVLGYLRVSHPWFEVTKPVRQLVLDLSLGIGLMIAAVAAIGWFLSGLAMEPVRESYQRLKQFTADASHELRSPIAIIQTNVQVALADPDPDPYTQQQHLKVVERLTRRLGRLVDDLLFLARQDSGIVQSRRVGVPLDGLLRDVIEEQQMLAEEKGIELVCCSMEASAKNVTNSITPLGLAEVGSFEGNASGTVPVTATTIAPTQPSTQDWSTLHADRDQLARLFTNLLGNALQYTPSGGKVSVALQQLKRSSNYFLQVVVSDTGIGIPPEALPRLFDRFYRVDLARTQASATGSGLGLAIAQAIVENHRGTIQIDSLLAQGTTVTVTLPQQEEG
ncbi:sensor histidine kinase [Stenomitos frigidus]|uniref:histidine kinase n=1 Tax=Stenomitos frigidus ULC18 TaxID=2107698 RepID=A0A2T1E676_9CYAN|nr:ATP-binding protein [Stenomitos frigidus]PSB28154.1 two-component sensor histidine kinase [Stenomitos frigidus ULC18]